MPDIRAYRTAYFSRFSAGRGTRALRRLVIVFGTSLKLTFRPTLASGFPSGVERIGSSSGKKIGRALSCRGPRMAAIFRLRLITAQRGGEIEMDLGCLVCIRKNQPQNTQGGSTGVVVRGSALRTSFVAASGVFGEWIGVVC